MTCKADEDEDMRIMPNGRITLSGLASTITGLSWLVESVELSLAARRG